MRSFTLEFGDASNDGHERSSTRTVTVLSDHSQETLVENFNRNVEQFQFDPRKVADEYEDSSIDKELLFRLLDAGLSMDRKPTDGKFSPYRFMDYETGDDIFTVEDAQNASKVMLGVDGYMEIIMFLMGHGLEGFIWDAPAPPTFFLNLTSLKNYNFGYGMF